MAVVVSGVLISSVDVVVGTKCIVETYISSKTKVTLYKPFILYLLLLLLSFLSNDKGCTEG